MSFPILCAMKLRRVLTPGHEFNDADTLTTSEAKLLIDVVLQKRPRDTGEEMPMTEYFLIPLSPCPLGFCNLCVVLAL